MKRIFLLILILSLCSCGKLQPSPQERSVKSRAAAMHQATGRKTVQIVHAPYLGAIPVELDEQKLPEVFSRIVTLNAAGTAPELAKKISELVPLRIEVEREESVINSQKESTPAGTGKLKLKYNGQLKGLLDYMCEFFGMGWEFDETTSKVEIARLMTRTFTLAAAPGNIKYESTITNKSQTSGSSTGSGGSVEGVGQTSKTSDSVSQTSQTNKASFTGDVWKDTTKAVEAMLSRDGRVVVNEAAGLISVTDTSTVLRRVGSYIKSLNTKMGRQVALAVKVWSLDVKHNADMGFDIETVLKAGQSSFSMLGGQPYSTLSGAGTLTAAILDGNWKDTELMLRALKQRGRTTLLTSGSGIVMNNQALPVQEVKRNAYLAGVSSTTTENSLQTSELTPGEVSTGFAMTVIPHIMNNRTAILQYNITLSSLDSMEEFTSGDMTIQLPQVSTRSFSQRVKMKCGQTLVIAGFEQETNHESKGLGISSGGHSQKYGKSLIIITIEMESAGV
ncbi:secretin N-terminal domain-containing protein [Maridesulfovibrio hydrothermalis]|uniref:Type II secretory pathway component PulD-like protein n=1 Tax=Maridesulfovibrio hydrothermalis AM13 = DSM 14728 TaxID=1121451 RepID=L0RCT0_9BACT|nr:secretin N-terminal domain-containing protein [Maridesulfovibrio hydrothermalis]CCO24022.1 Type II secretory pathway component PulD-like protein [Maridesulfovibrio hydrothermalis AM13 = DSM 14728]